MSDTCVRGCKVRGSHVTPCVCTADCDPAHEGHCTGCLPAEAVDGLLCRCSGRIRDALGAEPRNRVTYDRDQPWTLLMAWEQLRTLRPRLDAGGGDGTRRGHSVPDREAGRLADVLSLRDDIVRWLGVTTAVLSENIELPYPAELRLSDNGKVRPLAVEAKAWTTEVESRDFAIVRHCQAYLARHMDDLLSGKGWPDWNAPLAVVEVYDDLFRPRTVIGTQVLAAGLMNQARSLLRWDVETKIESDPCPICHAPGSVAVKAGQDNPTCTVCKAVLDPEAWARWKTWRQSIRGTSAPAERPDGPWRRTKTFSGLPRARADEREEVRPPT